MEIHVDLVPQAAAAGTQPAAQPSRARVRGPRDGARGGSITVVIDVLRAGTVAVLLFERGASAVTLISGVRAARKLAETRSAVLVGERGGVPPEGFNHGSSPTALNRVDFTDREVVMLARDSAAALALAGPDAHLASLNNAVATAARLLERLPDEVRLTCAGDRGEPDLADTVAAGLLVALLDRGARRGSGLKVSLHGAARYCLSVLRTTKDPLDGIWASGTGAELRGIGLEEDLAWASEVASSDVVPRLTALETVLGHPAATLPSG